MAEQKINNFVRDFKIRTIFPFYISNVNSLFFDVNDKNSNFIKSFIPAISEEFDEEELEKIKAVENLTDSLIIKKILNKSILKIDHIIKINNDSIFYTDGLKDAKNIYVKEKNDINDFDIIGSTHSSRRYNYVINLSKKTKLFNLAEQIQFSFYLDEKNKMLSGGVSFNWGKISSYKLSQKSLQEKFYLTNLVEVFIKDELKNLSANNFLELLEDFSEEKNKVKNKINKKNAMSKKNDKYNFSTLRQNWLSLINSKFLKFKKFSKTEIENYETELFYSILILIIISLIIYEDLKIYFNHEKPNTILSLLEKPYSKNKIEEETETIENCFFNLINYIRINYSQKTKIDYKNIKTSKEIIKALKKFKASMSSRNFGQPILSYEFTRNVDSPFLDEGTDIFLGNDSFKILFLLILKSELFGINDNEYNFIEFDEYEEFLNSIKINEEWNRVISETINETWCEWNYDYTSFIKKNLSFLIIKNDNPILPNQIVKKIKTENLIEYEKDANKRLYNNYFWAQIFSQNRLLMIKNIEDSFYQNKWKNPELLRKYIYSIHQLDFDWDDNFYGIPEIKTIIKKINEISKLKKNLKNLEDKIQSTDKFYGKSKERLYLGLALLTAGLFGISDFFTMVFTVLTVQDTSLGLNSVNLIFIGLGTFLTFILLTILCFTLIKSFLKKRKIKKEQGEL